MVIWFILIHTMTKEPRKPVRIAFFGEAMAELSLGGDHSEPPSLGFAGDTMNTAIYLKRLMGQQADVAYITVLGPDPLSDRLILSLENEFISTAGIARHADRPVGLYAITTDKAGERTFSYWRSHSAARTLFQTEQALNFDLLAGYDVVYFSAISLAILPANVRLALFDNLRQLQTAHSVKVVFDSNYRPALWESEVIAQQSVAEAWRLCDIALPSIDDEQNLFKDSDEPAVLARLRGYGITNGALKRGASGPLSLDNSVNELAETDHTANWMKEPVEVVDTTAAGDSFNAGYLSAALTNQSEIEALRAGHDCAKRVIAHRGAIIPLDQW